MDIVFSGFMALDATFKLFGEHRREIMERYPARIEDGLVELEKTFSKEINIDSENNIFIYECEGGGICEDLWYFAEAIGKGFEIDILSIPLRQETVEICECIGENPYKLSSKGCFLIETDRGQEFSLRLTEKGIVSSVIGFTTDKKARILKKRETISYLNKPR